MPWRTLEAGCEGSAVHGAAVCLLFDERADGPEVEAQLCQRVQGDPEGDKDDERCQENPG